MPAVSASNDLQRRLNQNQIYSCCSSAYYKAQALDGEVVTGSVYIRVRPETIIVAVPRRKDL